MTIREDWGK